MGLARFFTSDLSRVVMTAAMAANGKVPDVGRRLIKES